MNRSGPSTFRVALVALCLLAGAAVGGSRLAWSEPLAPSDNDQDVVILSESRPYVIRFQIETDGRGFRTAWREYLGTLAHYLDEDEDEVLSSKELDRAPWARLLREPWRSTSMAELLPKVDVDPNDEKITVVEWQKFVGEFGGTFELGQSSTQASAAGDPLLERLDVDEDGRLSEDELAAAPRRLRKLDLNDDDTIVVEELAPPQDAMAVDESAVSPDPIDHEDVLLLTLQENQVAVAKRILARYDSAGSDGKKNDKLSPAEVGFDPDQVALFDTDRDGELDATELPGILSKRGPDLAFFLRLGRRQRGTSRMELVADQTGIAPEQGGLQRIADNNWVLWLGGMKLDLRVLSGTVRPDAVVRFYQAHFFASDTDSNGYLGPDEARQSMIFRDVFSNMDADGDEKLYPQEVLDYLQHRTEVTLRRTELAVETYGRTLLEIIDSNRDNRLGKRELRDAFLMLEFWDRDGDGHVAPAEFPRELHLTISQGRGELPGGVKFQAPESGMPKTKPVAVNAPFWFTKMDRNRDGDVSPREFVGPREVFQGLDTDGDGLLDSDEARAAESLSER